jgi:hypothetical protein
MLAIKNTHLAEKISHASEFTTVGTVKPRSGMNERNPAVPSVSILVLFYFRRVPQHASSQNERGQTGQAAPRIRRASYGPIGKVIADQARSPNLSIS